MKKYEKEIEVFLIVTIGLYGIITLTNIIGGIIAML